MHEADIARLL